MTPSPLIERLVTEAVQKNASDLHLCDERVYFRIDNEIVPGEQLAAGDYETALASLIDERHAAELRGEEGATDLGLAAAGRSLRCSVYRSTTGIEAAIRLLPDRTFSPAEIGLDNRLVDCILAAKRGLVLLTGETGSGKSTTICTLIEQINLRLRRKIITIEDPVEFRFLPKESIFAQREVGTHCRDFRDGLRRALRHDPDVIFVGEIRDMDTARTVVHASLTGHVVFSTMHNDRVASAIETLAMMYPERERSELRTKLAISLLMVCSQRLLRRRGRGRVALREVLINNPAAASAIRQGNDSHLVNVMMRGRESGMADFEYALDLLSRANLCPPDEIERHREGVRGSNGRA